jgi:predicted small metal-binding protein
MGCGMMRVSCEDGFEVTTNDQKELVSMVQSHTQGRHGKRASEQEVLTMAKHP